MVSSWLVPDGWLNGGYKERNAVGYRRRPALGLVATESAPVIQHAAVSRLGQDRR
jgi:hypothetical protein